MSDAASPASPANLTAPDARRRRGRLNARTHGLTAALPDGDEEVAIVRAFIDDWSSQLGPETAAEDALIRSAASAFGRLERCRKAEEAALGDGARRAVELWEKKQRHAARKTGQGLVADPANTVADLEASSFGCEWLMRHWRSLDAVLAQGVGWDRHDLPLAMRLLGFRPQPPGPDGDPIAVRLWHLGLASSGHPVAPHPDLPDQPIPARGALRRLIASEFARLEALRDSHRDRDDRPRAEAVARAGLADTSNDGQLRRRYGREAFSEMVRGLKEATRLRADRARDDDRRRAQHGQTLQLPDDFDWQTPPAPSPAAPPPAPAAEAVAPAVEHRNEPPSEAPATPEDRSNPISANTLRNSSPGTPADPSRRTGPPSGAHRHPIEAPRHAGSGPMVASIAPRSSPTPADRAG